MHSPWRVVEMFEENIAKYCGSKYAIACDNCTDALLMCCQYLNVQEVTIPSRTYLSVPQSIIQAGGTPRFRDYDWSGIYQLEPYPIWDAAKRFTSNMYVKNSLMCLSFHTKKNLKIGKGGAILTDKKEDYEWFKRCRYSGRDHIEDNIETIGWNFYMVPEQAARGLTLLSEYPANHPDQSEEKPYLDLRSLPLFKKYEERDLIEKTP